MNLPGVAPGDIVDEEPNDQSVPGSTPGSSNDSRVWLLVAAMAVVAVALLDPQLSVPPELAVPTWKWWALLPIFATAEVFVIHLPTLRNAQSHTLREVPAVAGLAFLSPDSPLLYVSAYVLGSAIGLLLGRAQRGVKVYFNLSMFALEASLGVLVYQAVLGDANVADPRGWAAAFAVIVVTDLASALAVTAAISLTEDRFDGGVLRQAVVYGVPAAMVNTCMALLCVLLAVREPRALVLLALALLVLVVAYRQYVALGRGYSQLQLLYRFVGSAGRAVDVDEAVVAVLENARELLGGDRAELLVFAVDEEPGSRTTLEGPRKLERVPYTTPDPRRDAWWAAAALGESVLRPSHKTARRHAAQLSNADAPPRDGIAVPLWTDGRIEAVLLVANRTFEGQTFTFEDLRLFETLAGHAAVALAKVQLVASLRRLAEQRRHEARHDALTGLPNRRAFQETVDSRTDGAVLLIDLDDFKDVNDTLGHTAGDALLQQIGERIRLAAQGTVARLGGDEFAVLLTDTTAEHAVEQARSLLSAIGQPVQVEDVNLFVTASVGLALMPDHGDDANQLLQHADVAMYLAKAASSGIELYRPDDARAGHRRLSLAADLATTVDEHTFDVWYQPQADAVTGQIASMEALLRWQHPAYGAVPPEEMVALAERTGLLRRLTNAVLEDALRQRSAWSALGHHIGISVNITPLDLSDTSFPAVVRRLLDETGTSPGDLTLEITESGVMSDPARCLAVLDALAANGVRLAVDDFGIGQSSLAYLERLPVSEVKIDRSFVTRLEREESDAKVVRATVALAHDLGLHVVAEGVESQIAWARVADLGCELIQGYTLARPMPGMETVAWLDARLVSGGIVAPLGNLERGGSLPEQVWRGPPMGT